MAEAMSMALDQMISDGENMTMQDTIASSPIETGSWPLRPSNRHP
jgi:hypothetical protein